MVVKLNLAVMLRPEKVANATSLDFTMLLRNPQPPRRANLKVCHCDKEIEFRKT